MKYLLLLLFIGLLFSGCGSTEIDKDTEGYTKCTSVCATVIDEDLTMQWLCYEECKKKFLVNESEE